MLRKRRERDHCTEGDLNELKELAEASPARTWVHLLLLHIGEEAGSSFTLQKSQGIPPIPWEEEVPPGEWDFDRIVNRLKVMAGLDPVACREPRRGRISLTIHGIGYDLDVTFVDSIADSQCEITVHKAESPGR